MGKAAIGIRHQGSDSRRLGAHGIGKTSAKLKALAVRSFDLQRAHFAFVFAFARDVANHRGFSVIERFQFEQRLVAAGEVRRIGAMQHQAFAARANDVRELAFERRCL